MKFEYDPGKFYLSEKGEIKAEVIFTIENNILSINHTFVNSDYRGRGIAGKLMLAVSDYAQKNNLLINPVCSFAQKFFTRNSKYRSLLK